MKIAVVISLFGLAIVPLLLQQPNKLSTEFSFRKPLIGSLYTVLCVLGIVAIFYPRKCEESFMARTRSKEIDDKQQTQEITLEGHHPMCKEFSANRIEFLGNVLCAACTGLLIGAAISLTGALLYFFIGIEFIPANGPILFAGCSGLLVGLAQFKFRGLVKMSANIYFVLGSLITLLIVDFQAQNILIDLYVFGLIIFLLLTRILISEWNNTRTCSRCVICKLI